jgi:hypothetical protein
MIPDDHRRLRAFLALLASSTAIFEADDHRTLRVDDGTSLKRHAVNAVVLATAVAEGYVVVSGRNLTLTAAGQARLAMDQDTRPSTGSSDARPDAAPLVDMAESPLAWLYRRRTSTGRSILSAAEFQAGERLRTDYTKAGLMPSVTTNWRSMAAPGGSGVSRADLTDFALAARDRVQTALGAIGPELAGVALDVCCFLKGLEQVEMERIWPQRSAKVVLVLALKALARHYGFADETSGGEGGRAPRHWGTADFRPAITRKRS